MGMTRYFEEFQVGERIISRSRTLEMADIRMYSACTSLCARIHSDPVYCRGIPALKRITVPYSLVLNVVDGFYARASVRTVSRPFTTATTKRTTVHPFIQGTASIQNLYWWTSRKRTSSSEC